MEQCPKLFSRLAKLKGEHHISLKTSRKPNVLAVPGKVPWLS